MWVFNCNIKVRKRSILGLRCNCFDQNRLNKRLFFKWEKRTCIFSLLNTNLWAKHQCTLELCCLGANSFAVHILNAKSTTLQFSLCFYALNFCMSNYWSITINALLHSLYVQCSAYAGSAPHCLKSM